MRYFSFLVVITALVASCNSKSSNECSGKQVTCPGYDENVSKHWVPYKKNDVLVFTNGSLRDSFFINEVSISSAYQTTVSAGSANCNASAEWNYNDDKIYINIFTATDQYNLTKTTYVNINVKKQTFSGFGFSDTGLVVKNDNGPATEESAFYPSLLLQNKFFNNVQMLTVADTVSFPKNSNVYKIYLAKDKGVVAFEELHDHSLWVKQ